MVGIERTGLAKPIVAIVVETRSYSYGRRHLLV